MAIGTTKLGNLINPEVMADIITGKIENMIVATPFAKIDTTLQGRPGDTITVPAFAYIGDAEDVAEGVACGTTVLEATSTAFTVKKAMKAVELTDEAVLGGYGNPVGEATTQLAKAVESKMDADVIEVALTAPLKYDGSTDCISYNAVVSAIDVFKEEMNSEKAMFINPSQITQLRLDPDFIDKTKYGNDVMVNGEIGMISNVRIIPSNRIKLTAGKYVCPIIKLNSEAQIDDEAAAVTIFIKRGANVETQRDTLSRKSILSVDEIYGVALTNQEKVVIATFKSTAKAV